MEEIKKRQTIVENVGVKDLITEVLEGFKNVINSELKPLKDKINKIHSDKEYSIKEICEDTGKKYATIYGYIKSGILKHYKQGGSIRISQEAYDAFKNKK